MTPQAGPITNNQESIISPSPLVPEAVLSFTVLASPLGVEEQEAFQLSVYPNPVTDVLTLSDTQDAVRVEVVNALGQVVLSESITAAQHRIDLSVLTGGSYLVRTMGCNGTVRNALVMKR